MTELMIFLWAVSFCFLSGFLFEKNFEKKQKQEESKSREIMNEEIDCYPMELRIGFGVTTDKNPTFAELWVNIMKYNGESQTEEVYEENDRNCTEGYLD